MSILSLLASGALVGLVYGLSFVPSASLARPDDEVGLGLLDTVARSEDTGIDDDTAHV
ncbi:MAG: hypothetical protein AAGF48_15025 [Pseudomonadota bacterium]